ncbi:MAG: hypothetical protein HZA53_00875 [Planctomycetes bacterium]|nr:hypothetical protein [Planctomycetota bacterium]
MNAPTLLLAFLLPCSPTDEQPPALKGLDPVELTRGKEVAGDPKVSVDRGPHHYVFQSEANRKEFLADPERLGIQWGGACGRMGPGSGRGSPDRYWVQDGRIFVFASEPCRASFKQDPAAHFDPDEAPVEGDDAALKAGREWIERAVTAHGGAKAIDGMQRLALIDQWEEQGQDGPIQRARALLCSFPDDFCLQESWGDWESKTVARKSECFAWYTGGKTEDEHVSARRDFERRLAREPLLILRARTRPDFRAVVEPLPKDDPLTLAYVVVSFARTRTKLGLDPRSGAILELQYRGRGPSSKYGPMKRLYASTTMDGKAVTASKGVKIPYEADVEFEGKSLPTREKHQRRAEVDVEFEANVFARP